MANFNRKFDWTVASELAEDGWSAYEIAEELGVTSSAVYFALDPKKRERNNVNLARWQKSGICDDCGVKCSHNPASRRARGKNPDEHLCRPCAARRRAESAFADRLSADGSLILCRSCGRYLDITDFYETKHGLAESHCKDCGVRKRQERRMATA